MLRRQERKTQPEKNIFLQHARGWGGVKSDSYGSVHMREGTVSTVSLVCTTLGVSQLIFVL